MKVELDPKDFITFVEKTYEEMGYNVKLEGIVEQGFKKLLIFMSILLAPLLLLVIIQEPELISLSYD